MSAQLEGEVEEAIRSCAQGLRCPACKQPFPLDYPDAFCPECSRSLDVTYDYDLARRLIAGRPLASRPQNIWRFAELLPIHDQGARERVGATSGFTPLLPAPRLAAELGLGALYLKDDSSMRPTFSYKDRVVSMSVARLLELGKEELGCVSTGNVGHSTAALCARAGIPAYIFYPNRLEPTKAKLCRALGAQVCQLDATYDEANKACRQLAKETGLHFANITLRPFYSEGGKTEAFEIVEQLGWQAPDHILLPVAGGTLSSRIHKGLNELETVGLARTAHTRLHVVQPEGCAPIANALLSGADQITPCEPRTQAHSLAIGAPGDAPLVLEAVRARNGTAATVSDQEIFEAIDLLARLEGVFTEPAGGTAIAGLKRLAAKGTIGANESAVVVITGNGMKTIEDHPAKGWPRAVPCVQEAIREELERLREAAAPAPA